MNQKACVEQVDKRLAEWLGNEGGVVDQRWPTFDSAMLIQLWSITQFDYRGVRLELHLFTINPRKPYTDYYHADDTQSGVSIAPVGGVSLCDAQDDVITGPLVEGDHRKWAELVEDRLQQLATRFQGR